MKTLIKWPGGKTSEIEKIETLIPKHNRYIEPFFGGGALFFHLTPASAEINDISESLIQFYRLVQQQDKYFYSLLCSYQNSFSNLVNIFSSESGCLCDMFFKFKNKKISSKELKMSLRDLICSHSNKIESSFSENLVLNNDEFYNSLCEMANDKFARTLKHYNNTPFSYEDLRENLVTGFTNGYYMYFRKIYNDLNLKKLEHSAAYQAANFYFIREYCYGSMFRCNAKGEFNVAYGGVTYNRKDFKAKIENMFNKETSYLFSGTRIHCSDFESFLKKVQPTSKDFIFLDPPYDTEFSTYDSNNFSKFDQERLAFVLRNTDANFLLIIKNTDFIKGLYEPYFNISGFDKKYQCNFAGRNDRNVEHLIITNMASKTA